MAEHRQKFVFAVVKFNHRLGRRAHRLLGIDALGDIAENHGHLLAVRPANPKCIDIEPGIHVLQSVHEAHRLPGQADLPVRFDPICLDTGRQFAHPLPDGVGHSGLPRERRVDLQETHVDSGLRIIENHFDDTKCLVHRIEQRPVSFFGLLQRLGRNQLLLDIAKQHGDLPAVVSPNPERVRIEPPLFECGRFVYVANRDTGKCDVSECLEPVRLEIRHHLAHPFSGDLLQSRFAFEAWIRVEILKVDRFSVVVETHFDHAEPFVHLIKERAIARFAASQLRVGAQMFQARPDPRGQFARQLDLIGAPLVHGRLVEAEREEPLAIPDERNADERRDAEHRKFVGVGPVIGRNIADHNGASGAREPEEFRFHKLSQTIGPNQAGNVVNVPVVGDDDLLCRFPDFDERALRQAEKLSQFRADGVHHLIDIGKEEQIVTDGGQKLQIHLGLLAFRHIARHGQQTLRFSIRAANWRYAHVPPSCLVAQRAKKADKATLLARQRLR